MTSLTYRPSAIRIRRPTDRKNVRYPVEEPTSWRVLLHTDTESVLAKVKNLSTHGIGLVVDRPLDPGSTMEAELTNSCQLFTSRQTIRVIHSTQQDEQSYLVGCEFSAPLDYDQVRALAR